MSFWWASRDDSSKRGVYGVADGLMNVWPLCKQPKEHICVDWAPRGLPAHITHGISVSLCWRQWGRMIDEDVWVQIDHQIIGKSIWCNAVINPISHWLLTYEPRLAVHASQADRAHETEPSAQHAFISNLISFSLRFWAEVNLPQAWNSKPADLKETFWTSFDNYVVLPIFSLRLHADVMCLSRISGALSQLLPARLVEMS